MPSYKLSDPYFNEFVFHCIVSATREQKNRLPFDLYNAATTPGKARTFVDDASLEKKITMLAHLGISFSMWFAPPEHLDTSVLEDTREQFKSDRLNTVNRMIQSRSFVFTDREVMSMLVMMAQNCHNETYVLNRDYYALSEELTSLHEVSPESVNAVKPALSEFKLICKFIFNLLMHQDFVDGLSGYKEIQLSILLYLFLHRQSYVDQKTIIRHLYPAFQKNRVSLALIHLRSKLLIDRLPQPSNASKKFIITSSGISLIGNYLQRIVTQTFR